MYTVRHWIIYIKMPIGQHFGGIRKKLLALEGRMYLSVCVYPFSPHTKLSLQFRSSESCGERLSDTSALQLIKVHTVQWDWSPSDATPDPSISCPASSSIGRSTSVHRQFTASFRPLPPHLSPVWWVVTVIGHQWDGWSLVTDSDPESAIEGYQHLVAGEANARSQMLSISGIPSR